MDKGWPYVRFRRSFLVKVQNVKKAECLVVGNCRLKLRKKSANFKSDSLCQEGLDLSAWGLPDLVLRQYYNQGIHKLFEWQSECLATHPNVVHHGGSPLEFDA